MSETERVKGERQAPRAVPGQLATGRRYVPNVPVVAQDGRRLKFYDDLVADRVVLIHFMSIASEASYPVVRGLSRFAALLGGRLGRDVHLYSITTDPGRDTPEALRGFAARRKTPSGWLFLGGDPPALRAIREAFFIHDDGHDHGRADPAAAGHGHGRGRFSAAEQPSPDCSLGLLRYGSDALGLWGSAPARARPEALLERLAWLQPRARREEAGEGAGGLRRGGPRPLA